MLDLVELALNQIVRDVENWDLSAIEELLRFVPEENLIAYLPEEITNA